MKATTAQFKTMNDLFTYYNKKLFVNRLPDCIVGFARVRGMAGAFIPDTWTGNPLDKPMHEIVLNANIIGGEDKFVHSVLVHEMCHLMEDVYGKRARWGYHTHSWAARMREIGLQPSHTGEEGGQETGRRMRHYVIPGGLFEKAFEAITKKEMEKYRIPYQAYRIQRPVVGELPTRSGGKTGYICECGSKVWGKPDLEFTCKICKTDFQMISK